MNRPSRMGSSLSQLEELRRWRQSTRLNLANVHQDGSPVSKSRNLKTQKRDRDQGQELKGDPEMRRPAHKTVILKSTIGPQLTVGIGRHTETLHWSLVMSAFSAVNSQTLGNVRYGECYW
jgi:hypothetical protein